MNAEDYKTIRFSDKTETEFLNLVREKGLKHGFSHMGNIYFWVEEADRSRKWNADSLNNLVDMMRSDRYYTERHIWKLRYTFDVFLEGGIK